jgi:hypothetical protein
VTKLEALKKSLKNLQGEKEKVEREIAAVKIEMEREIIAKTLLGKRDDHEIYLTLRDKNSGEEKTFKEVRLPFFKDLNLTETE